MQKGMGMTMDFFHSARLKGNFQLFKSLSKALLTGKMGFRRILETGGAWTVSLPLLVVSCGELIVLYSEEQMMTEKKNAMGGVEG